MTGILQLAGTLPLSSEGFDEPPLRIVFKDEIAAPALAENEDVAGGVGFEATDVSESRFDLGIDPEDLIECDRPRLARTKNRSNRSSMAVPFSSAFPPVSA